MANAVFYAITSVIAVSMISLIGIVSVIIRKELLNKILPMLVSFSAGALLGGVFLHLLPEAAENYGFGTKTSIFTILGILIFFILEKFIHWRHCHVPTSKSHPHPLAIMNFVGDGVHNLIDGMAIAAGYLTSFEIGLATTIAVLLHEIPQEIGDFGILLYAGLGKKKALLLNFASALTALLGAATALALNGLVGNISSFLIPFAAGGFIYIAGSDIIPELHKETNIKKSALQLACIILGIGMMTLIK